MSYEPWGLNSDPQLNSKPLCQLSYLMGLQIHTTILVLFFIFIRVCVVHVCACVCMYVRSEDNFRELVPFYLVSWQVPLCSVLSPRPSHFFYAGLRTELRALWVLSRQPTSNQLNILSPTSTFFKIKAFPAYSLQAT